MNQQQPVRSTSPSSAQATGRGGGGMGGMPPPSHFGGGVVVGGIPRGGMGRGNGGPPLTSTANPGVRGGMTMMMGRGNGSGGGAGLGGPQPPPPGAHVVKGPPAPSGAGRGAASSMSIPGGPAVPPGANGFAMRGKMPSFSVAPQLQPGMHVKMPPGQAGKTMMGKKMMMPPPPANALSRQPSPSMSVRSTSPAIVSGGGGGATSPSPSGRPMSQQGGAPSLQQQRPQPPPLIGGAPGNAAGPHPPQFAMVNGKKMFVPPGTKLPGPGPPGMQMAGKKMMMMPGGGGPPLPVQQPNTSPPAPGMKQPMRMPSGGPGPRPGTTTSPPNMSNRSSGPSLVRPMQGPPPAQQQQQQQQQQRQRSPPESFFSPSHPLQQQQLPQQSPPVPPPGKTKKRSGLMGGLSGALNFLKLGSDDEDEGKEAHDGRNAPPPQMQSQMPFSMSGPSPSSGPQAFPTPQQPGPSPQPPHQQTQSTPPRNGAMAMQGKKMMVPPGVKLPPGANAPQPLLPSFSPHQQQQQQHMPASAMRGPPPPPGAMKISMGAHPTPPRSGSVLSNANDMSSSTSAVRVRPPGAQSPHKVLLKAPPGAVVTKKVLLSPSAAAQVRGGRQQSPERPPLASLPSSRSDSFVTPPRTPLEDTHGQQQEQHRPPSAGAHLVKHMMGPPPPGAKLISSPPKGFVPVGMPQHPPPQPMISSAASAGLLRVPSSTVLKDEELPEAGMRTSPHPRRRLGESSEDSDDDSTSDLPHQRQHTMGTATAHEQVHADSNADQHAAQPSEDVAAAAGSSPNWGDDGEHKTGIAAPADASPASEKDDIDVGREKTRDGDDAPPSRSRSSLRPPSQSGTASSSRSPSVNIQNKKGEQQQHRPTNPPPVRQTAATAAAAARSAAAAAAAAKKKEEQEENERKEEERRQRKTAAEAAQKRRQAKLAEARRAPKAKVEPASPQEEENTQKPVSVDRSTDSVVSTPSRASAHTTTVSASDESILRHGSSVSAEAQDTNDASLKRRKEGRTGKAKDAITSTKKRGTSPSQPMKSTKKGRDKVREMNSTSAHKRHARSTSEDGEDDTSGSERLTSRELYRLVNALRGERQKKGSEKDTDKLLTRSRQRSTARDSDMDSIDNELQRRAEDDNEASDVSDDWGLRSDHSGQHRRRAVSTTRRRQREQEAEAGAASARSRRRSSLPASTVGIPWRYTSAARTSEPFSTPPPVRRPLGYINVGGGRYARVGGSPYVQRHASAPRSDHAGFTSPSSPTSIPLDRTNTALNLNSSSVQGNSAIPNGLDPATSALVNARDNAVVAEVRASLLSRNGSPLSGARGSSAVYYTQQSQASSQPLRRLLQLTSPIRLTSPVRQDVGLNESISTVDSHHPYCTSASALLPSMQALTPIRRPLTSQQQQQRANQPYDHQPFTSPTSAAAATREPITEISAAEQVPPAQQQQQQQQDPHQQREPVAARCADPSTTQTSSPTAAAEATRWPFAALRRSAFFESLHSGGGSDGSPNALITSSAAIVGGSGGTGNLPLRDGNNALPGGSAAASLLNSSSAQSGGGWEWVPRRPATPADSRASSAKHNSRALPYASPSSRAAEKAEKAKEEEENAKVADIDTNESDAPSLVPRQSNAVTPRRPNASPPEQAAAVASARSRSRRSSARGSSPGTGQANRRQTPNTRTTSIGAAVSAAATGPRSYKNHYNPDPYRPPSRTKEPVHLTRATVARLSTPQLRRGGGGGAAAAMISPITRRSGGGDATSNSAHPCSKWLDEILGSTTVTATGVKAGGDGQDAAAASALPVVDLRSEFKPRVADIEASGVGKRAAVALLDPEMNDYARDFIGSRPRPHIPEVSFKHMIGVRTQSPGNDTSASVGAPGAGPASSSAAAAPSAVAIRQVHGVEDGLPFEQYSSIRIHDPMRKSPWALAPEREGLDVLPGKPALSRRRRIPSLPNGNGARGDSDGEGNEESDGHHHYNTTEGKRSEVDGRTVVEEVHLDEHRRPYLVVRPVPDAEAAAAQRMAVERLSKPKPLYQRAE